MQSRVSREWQLFFYEVESGSLVLVWHQLGVERLVANEDRAASGVKATSDSKVSAIPIELRGALVLGAAQAHGGAERSWR